MSGLSISGAALATIKNQLQRMGDAVYIPTVVWAEDANGKGAWEVGYHQKTDVPKDFILKINALDVVVEPQWREMLAGKTLDFKDGYFTVC